MMTSFGDVSRKFFDLVKDGDFTIVVSRTTLDEINEAPLRVQRILGGLAVNSVELFYGSELEIERLAKAYMDAGIIGCASADDAIHIATATIAAVDFVVSWNFKHIVHYDKIQGYQAINLLSGYKPIDIYSPREVV